MTDKPSFGFGAGGLASGLAKLPASAPEAASPVSIQDIDKAGERLGFVQREAAPAPVRRKKRVGGEEPTDQINIRAAVADLNAFVEWCERKRYSYREGFAELVSKIED